MNKGIRIVDPMEILKTSQRFDLVFKVALAKAWAEGSASEIREAEEAYLESIRARSGFMGDEGDCPPRETPKAFIEAFRKTAKSIHKKGFDLKCSPVPLDKNLELLNGAHRLSACAAYGCPCAVEINDIQCKSGSVYETFIKGHLDEAVRNWGVRKYLELLPGGCLCLDFGSLENYPPLPFPNWSTRNRLAWRWKIRPFFSLMWNHFILLFRYGARAEKTKRRIIRESKKITGFAALAAYWKEFGQKDD